MKRVQWYCEKLSTPARDSFSGDIDIEFFDKLPDTFGNTEQPEPLLIVIDDFMDVAVNHLAVSQLFTRTSHHDGISVILLTQNIYNQGKYSRNISLNATYYVIFRNLRDQIQINKFLQQVCGGSAKAIQNVFHDAVDNKPHSYLFIDFSQKGRDLLRLRANLFARNSEPIVIYCPREALSGEMPRRHYEKPF